MSAWSDWQCGAITWDDYRFECEKEDRREREDEDDDEMPVQVLH